MTLRLETRHREESERSRDNGVVAIVLVFLAMSSLEMRFLSSAVVTTVLVFVAMSSFEMRPLSSAAVTTVLVFLATSSMRCGHFSRPLSRFRSYPRYVEYEMRPL